MLNKTKSVFFGRWSVNLPTPVVIILVVLCLIIALETAAVAQNYPCSPSSIMEARPLAIGTSVIRQPAGPRLNRLSGNSYFVDWNVTPNFAVEGKFEQANAPISNSNPNQIMGYNAYEIGIQESFSAKFIRPNIAGYVGSGWVNRRESGILWHEPDTALLGVAVGFDAKIMMGTTVRLNYQASRWIPFWMNSTNKNTNNVSFGLVHRFDSSFGREWKVD